MCSGMPVRRDRYSEAYVDRSLARHTRLAIKHDEETDSDAPGATGILARKEDPSLYHAACLELANRRDLRLASCEKALLSAAARRKVTMLATWRPIASYSHQLLVCIGNFCLS
jgi:predicted nucleic acid-binding protein